jgi:hypothetical protein
VVLDTGGGEAGEEHAAESEHTVGARSLVLLTHA